MKRNSLFITGGHEMNFLRDMSVFFVCALALLAIGEAALLTFIL